MGAPNTIARLPEDVREALHGYLRDPGITQREALARANALLAELGLPPLSKSAVNRYDLKMRAAGERLQQAREVADAWIGRLGAAPQGQLGHLLNELLRTLAFDIGLKLGDAPLTPDTLPGVITQLRGLSLSAARLERAATENVKREKEIRRQAAEELAETVERESKAGANVTPARLREIAREVYGA